MYLGMEDFKHGEAPRIGVLLTNLGTPAAPTAPALRRYLREFLSDPRVIEYPRWLWWLILNGIILNTRPKKSAALYQKIWTDEGSPLFSISKQQMQALSAELSARGLNNLRFSLGMRYGKPSIADALEELRREHVQALIVLPLYPQYSATTVGSTFDAVAEVLQRSRFVPDMRFINSFHDEPGYIEALAKRVEQSWQNSGRGQKLLMSFHGIPKRYFLGGDPYYCHCQKTARLLATRLGLSEGEYIVSFQSLFGKEEWLKPYTDETIKALPSQGVTSLDVICPGFAADCLETLEEIDGLNREFFHEAGGKEYRYIPAVNDSPTFISTLADIAQRNLATFPAHMRAEASRGPGAQNCALSAAVVEGAAGGCSRGSSRPGQ